MMFTDCDFKTPYRIRVLLTYKWALPKFDFSRSSESKLEIERLNGCEKRSGQVP